MQLITKLLIFYDSNSAWPARLSSPVAGAPVVEATYGRAVQSALRPFLVVARRLASPERLQRISAARLEPQSIAKCSPALHRQSVVHLSRVLSLVLPGCRARPIRRNVCTEVLAYGAHSAMHTFSATYVWYKCTHLFNHPSVLSFLLLSGSFLKPRCWSVSRYMSPRWHLQSIG